MTYARSAPSRPSRPWSYGGAGGCPGPCWCVGGAGGCLGPCGCGGGAGGCLGPCWCVGEAGGCLVCVSTSIMWLIHFIKFGQSITKLYASPLYLFPHTFLFPNPFPQTCCSKPTAHASPLYCCSKPTTHASPRVLLLQAHCSCLSTCTAVPSPQRMPLHMYCCPKPTAHASSRVLQAGMVCSSPSILQPHWLTQPALGGLKVGRGGERAQGRSGGGEGPR